MTKINIIVATWTMILSKTKLFYKKKLLNLRKLTSYALHHWFCWALYIFMSSFLLTAASFIAWFVSLIYIFDYISEIKSTNEMHYLWSYCFGISFMETNQ